MKIEFFVPEIRGKGRPRLTKSGHAFTDEKTRNYENLVKLLAMEAMKKAGAMVTDKPVKATINAYFEIPKSYTKKKVQAIINGEIKPGKPDLDNIIKCIDGCNKIIFKERKVLFMDFNVFLRDLISAIDYFMYDVVVWLSQFFPGLML